MDIITNPITLTVIVACVISLLIFLDLDGSPSKYSYKSAETRAKEAICFEFLKIAGVIILGIILTIAWAYHENKTKPEVEQEHRVYTDTVQP